MERFFAVATGLAVALFIASVAYGRGQRSMKRAVHTTHGPMHIIVTNAQDGSEATPDVIKHPVTVSVLSDWDGGAAIECRQKDKP